MRVLLTTTSSRVVAAAGACCTVVSALSCAKAPAGIPKLMITATLTLLSGASRTRSLPLASLTICAPPSLCVTSGRIVRRRGLAVKVETRCSLFTQAMRSVQSHALETGNQSRQITGAEAVDGSEQLVLLGGRRDVSGFGPDLRLENLPRQRTSSFPSGRRDIGYEPPAATNDRDPGQRFRRETCVERGIERQRDPLCQSRNVVTPQRFGG